MKIIARAFVLALAVTGLAASSNISSSAKTTVSVAKTSAMPIPTCPPDGTSTCNIRGGW